MLIRSFRLNCYKLVKMSVTITKVLLLDNVDPSAEKILQENGIKANLCKEKFTTEQLISTLQDYDGLVVRSATKVTSTIFEQCPKLRIVGRAGVGVDNVDIKSATNHGVIVMNTPGGNTISAAEHTCALICCLSRNIPAADASMKAGKWDRKAFMGHELLGKTLGVVGLGRIGREAAIRMQSFGMTTIGFDPLVSKEEAAKYNIAWMTLDEIWPKADYITVHTPLIPQTRGLLNDASFAKCKHGVRVINCARGGIIDEDALLRALESGQCGGAGLDVYVEEPATNFALVKHPKVVACPHLGASTKEGQARCGKEVAEQFVDVMKGTSFFGVLNAPALTQSAGLEGWLSAASSLGKLLNGFASPLGASEIAIEMAGAELAKAGNCLKAAVCAGFMWKEGGSVNLINAGALATEKGVTITVSNNASDVTLCSVQAKNENVSIKLTASVANGKGVLVAINSQCLTMPFPLEGSMVLCQANTGLSKVIDAVTSCGGVVTSLSTTPVEGGMQWVAMATSLLVDLNSHSELKTSVAIAL